MNTLHRRGGFTLLELLVVVTIMVVLLAILVPALDKAIDYADELRCMSNLKHVSSAALQYTIDNRSRLPVAKGRSGEYGAWAGIEVGVTPPGAQQNVNGPQFVGTLAPYVGGEGTAQKLYRCPSLYSGASKDIPGLDYFLAEPFAQKRLSYIPPKSVYRAKDAGVSIILDSILFSEEEGSYLARQNDSAYSEDAAFGGVDRFSTHHRDETGNIYAAYDGSLIVWTTLRPPGLPTIYDPLYPRIDEAVEVVPYEHRPLNKFGKGLYAHEMYFISKTNGQEYSYAHYEK